jgi:hypothetical protein
MLGTVWKGVFRILGFQSEIWRERSWRLRESSSLGHLTQQVERSQGRAF